MENKPAISLSKNLPNIKPDLPENYQVPSSSRRWELSISYKTKVYLTNEEAEYYMSMVNIGKKKIRVGALFLTSNYLSMIPIRNNPKQQIGEIIYY